MWKKVLKIKELNPILKLVPAIFLTHFRFSLNDSPSKTMKNVFFHLKSSFRSWDIQIFVYSSSPLLLPVSHYFRAWLKKNLKVCDVITCLNKDLIKHFVWYLEKEIRCDFKTLSIDRVLNTKNFMWNSCRKYAPKASPRPLFNFSK